MAEIKSTIDLVMEKTQDLSMSEEEKKELHRQRLKDKARALIQKFLEAKVDIKAFKQELNSEEQNVQELKNICKQFIFHHLQLEAENKDLLQLLEQGLELDIALLRKLLSSYQEEINTEKSRLVRRSKEDLKEQGVSGSALIPNLELYPEWKRFKTEKKEEFRSKLESII